MIEINNVVVPYDFSKRCRAAAGHAVAMAQRFDAPMTLLHVIPYSSFEFAAFEAGGYAGVVWPAKEEIVARLRAELQEIPAPERVKEACQLVALEGEPSQQIVEFVAAIKAPLVVMPTQGHGAFRRFLLGSVTTKALHDLTCPVLTGAHLEEHPHFGGEKYERVACALDFGEYSEETLRFAADFAKAWDATLTVVHASAWLDRGDADSGLLTASMHESLLDASKAEAVALLQAVGCDADLRVGFGRPRDFVPKTVREIRADILVTGRRIGKEGGGLRAYGHDLIRSSPCPVLSV